MKFTPRRRLHDISQMTVCFLIIIFNDNDMSIAEVHGGMYKGFRELREMKVLNFGLSKKFYDRYDYEALARENHLTAEQIAEDVMKVLG